MSTDFTFRTGDIEYTVVRYELPGSVFGGRGDADRVGMAGNGQAPTTNGELYRRPVAAHDRQALSKGRTALS
jgi:hypothetical protein